MSDTESSTDGLDEAMDAELESAFADFVADQDSLKSDADESAHSAVSEPHAPQSESEIERLQLEIQNVLQRERSAAGRVTAHQRLIEERDRQIAELRSLVESKSRSAPGDETLSKDLEELAEAFPDIAAPILRKMKQVEDTLAKKSEAIDALISERVGAANIQQGWAEAAKVEDEVPGWAQVVNTKQWESWLMDAIERRPTLRRLAEINGKTLVDADAALLLFTQFANDTGAAIFKGREAPQRNALRDKRLQSSAGPPSRVSAASRSDSDELMAGFALATKK